MQSIVIETKDKKEFAFLLEMLRKMNIKMRFLNEDETSEDLLMGKSIDEGMKTKTVSKQTVLKSLKK